MPDERTNGKVVLLTLAGLEHRYVARTLSEALGPRLCAVIVTDPRPRRLTDTVQGYLRRYTPAQIASRVHARTRALLKRRGPRSRRAIAGVLFPDGPIPELPRGLVRSVPSHNGPECLALLESLEPDVVAIYGTGIIRDAVIERARRSALNMHTGLSPRYRGADTVFWPIHNQEPEWIGVTVHVLDQGIDSGAILATGRPTIEPDDDEHTLFAKCVRVGAVLYAEAIQKVLAGTARATPQALEKGRQYRFVDRTVAAERRVERLLREGLLRDRNRHAPR